MSRSFVLFSAAGLAAGLSLSCLALEAPPVTPVETVESPAPDRYTLELAPNGRLLVRADCNRGTGAYRIGAGTLEIGPITTTRMACPPGSLDARYLGDLQRAAAHFVEGGELFIELPVDSGAMRFAPQR